MTYREAVIWAADKLSSAGIENETAESRLLLEFACHLDLNFYLLHQNEQMEEADELRFCTMVKQRCLRIPLQHLTGTQEFMGLPFCVNEHVLIPRQDTEILAEEALRILSAQLSKTDNAGKYKPGQMGAAAKSPDGTGSTTCRVLDLCTGSGCIAVSLKAFCPEILVCGSDISADALKVAKRNAALNHVEVEMRESDLFSALDAPFFMIVSNPPYIPCGEIPQLMPEVRDHEPLLALDGENDGLAFYRRIIKESADYLLPGGWLLFEIGCDQGNAVSELMRMNGFIEIDVMPDLAGLDRVVKGRRKEDV